ncbi:GNAT family acetyltransferase [Rhodotorula taiwanensis]|uniref:Glycylpeptide N-tetradecanoyltransferase n=1 Tax=Rhodotorula taiwanensis TaxID=741276 RepID=A0A2S5BC61_9BASI|nr:GNAT family acetyltransferase [Rhodotorula taiwanensis]
MDESKMQATAADLERALVDSLVEAAMPTSTADDNKIAHDATTGQAQVEDNANEPTYQDGDLPDFSDSEETATTTSDSKSTPFTRASSAGGGGQAGKGPRRKIPLAAIKARMSGAGPAGKKAAPPAAAAAAAAAAPVASTSQPDNKGKGKSKELKLSDSQLDAVAKKLAAEHPELPKLSPEQVQELVATMQIDKDVLSGKKGLMGKGTKDMASHKFWKTQPVVKLDQRDEVREGVLEADKKPEEVPKEPVALHKDFKWVTVNLSDANELREVYELLTHHYVEDLDATFRFDYSPEFIEWALKPPGYFADWHVGIRVAETGKLVGFIAGIPIELRVRNATKRCTEINFLVVHKKLRSKRFAPILIQEVTRRTHLRGIFQAIYTAGVFLPTPVSRCQYYHRNLNPPKLVKLGFSAVPRNSTVARMSTFYRVATETALPGLRELEKRDLKQASRLVRAYMARFDMAPLLSNKDIEHALWTGRGKDVNGKREGQVTWAYVVEDPTTHRITDVFSFYALPSTALKSQPISNVNAAYLYYYATTAAPSCADLGDGSVAVPVTNWKDETPGERKALGDRLKVLMADALVIAARNGFDVVNSLTIQDNSLFLEDLKFGKGDGFLHYYLYNYATKPIAGGIDADEGGSGIGVVMLCTSSHPRAVQPGTTGTGAGN